MFKDQAVVLDRRSVGDNDVLINVYIKMVGIENIFVQNGQLIKNLPFTYLDKLTYFRGVFVKFKNDRFYIQEIDKVFPVGLMLSKNYDNFVYSSQILNFISTYAPYSDEKVFNLLKKTLHYMGKSNDGYKYYVAFLVKFNYLLGIYDQKNIFWDRKSSNILSQMLLTNISDIKRIPMEKGMAEMLSDRLIRNINRWLS